MKNIEFTVNGQPVAAREGTSVAAAVMNSGFIGVRRSVSGEFRSPLCGMGICFECRVTIDGKKQEKSCQTYVRNGMKIRIDADN